MNEQKQKTPIDEMCYCGYLRSEHNDLKFVGIDAHPSLKGKGDCPAGDCIRFTWKEFIFKDGE